MHPTTGLTGAIKTAATVATLAEHVKFLQEESAVAAVEAEVAVPQMDVASLAAVISATDGSTLSHQNCLFGLCPELFFYHKDFTKREHCTM